MTPPVWDRTVAGSGAALALVGAPAAPVVVAAVVFAAGSGAVAPRSVP
ncbi:hypothetical protein [Quadrisphaera setariae]|nr:hypothetical protein [Quadrisphaera setariae]